MKFVQRATKHVLKICTVVRVFESNGLIFLFPSLALSETEMELVKIFIPLFLCHIVVIFQDFLIFGNEGSLIQFLTHLLATRPMAVKLPVSCHRHHPLFLGLIFFAKRSRQLLTTITTYECIS